MAQRRSVVLREVVDSPWTRAPSIAIGRVPAGRGTPLLYGLVERDGWPEWRIDVYGDPGEETYFRSAAVPWAGGIALGFGWHVYLITGPDRPVRTLHLSRYFQDFRVGEDYLLVLFGAGLMRLGPTGEHIWENSDLAVDGVVVDAIEAGVIRGQGEWDPPGRWRPFAVSLADGRLINAGPPAG
jgi:hypothetical protein